MHVQLATEPVQIQVAHSPPSRLCRLGWRGAPNAAFLLSSGAQDVCGIGQRMLWTVGALVTAWQRPLLAFGTCDNQWQIGRRLRLHNPPPPPPPPPTTPTTPMILWAKRADGSCNICRDGIYGTVSLDVWIGQSDTAIKALQCGGCMRPACCFRWPWAGACY